MSKETCFFIYLLERYADYRGMPTPQVLSQWDDAGITELIYGLYEIYHAERLQNAFEDIDRLLAG